jgi:cytochrome c556
MRQMLGSIGGAMSAAAKGDSTALQAALAPAGSAAAADPAIEALLPAQWKELAERTHGGFDSLAIAARGASNPAALKDTVLVRLAQISGSCTSCHETYRVTVK